MFQKKRADQLGLGDVIRCDAFVDATVDKDEEYGDSAHVGGTYPPDFRRKLCVDPTRKHAYYVVERVEGQLNSIDWRWVYARRLGPDMAYDPEAGLISFAQKLDRFHTSLLEVEYYGRMNKDRTAILFEAPRSKTDNR